MKTEFVHEILQSCEKLNHMGNSQKKCFIYLCVHLCVHSKTQHSMTAEKLTYHNERFMKVKSGLFLRLEKTVFCSNVHPFCCISFWIPHQH